MKSKNITYLHKGIWNFRKTTSSCGSGSADFRFICFFGKQESNYNESRSKLLKFLNLGKQFLNFLERLSLYFHI